MPADARSGRIRGNRTSGSSPQYAERTVATQHDGGHASHAFICEKRSFARTYGLSC
jgi:hypothetical protein